MVIRIETSRGSNGRDVRGGQWLVTGLAIVLVAVTFVAGCDGSADDPVPTSNSIPTSTAAPSEEEHGNTFKVGQDICLPAPVEAGKAPNKTTIERGGHQVTDAQPNKTTGDPRVRLRLGGEGDPRARRTPWVGERKLLDNGAFVVSAGGSC